MVYSADRIPGEEAIIRTTQLQAKAGILGNVRLFEGEDVTSDSEV